MSAGLQSTSLAHRTTTLAAFLLPALALWVPSGYSYAAVLLLLGALGTAPQWLRRRPDPATATLALLLCAMGGMWFLLSLDTGAGRWDKGLKWLLGVPCLLFAVAFPPRPEAFRRGLPIGCAGMGLLALWQVAGQGLERATGYTNAIQWGNLALLLGCLHAVQLALFWREHRWPWRIALVLAAVLALVASLLSQSRGGWLALCALVPVLLVLAWRIDRHAFGRLLLGAGLGLAALVLVLATAPPLRDRVDLAASEISGFLTEGKGDNSVGLRLVQYQLVAELIPQKPWLGWGAHGFVQEMQRRVDQGTLPPVIMGYPQVHNDLLDVWVKVGVGGLLLQMALYGWVFAMFWPRGRRLQRLVPGSPAWREALALRTMGCLVPVAYFVFGLSQPFFNHNSGIMGFVFYVTVLWGALRGVEQAHA